MSLYIRPLVAEDYDKTLCQWWFDWRWTPPSRDFLPENGTGGYIVYDEDMPVCAGFMYETNSKAVWCDWIISYVYALIKNKPLINVYKKQGFKEGSSYTHELIKTI